MRSDLIKENAWLPEALFMGFVQAKRRAVENLGTDKEPKIPLPWGPDSYQVTMDLMGKNYWSYGVPNNPRSLKVLLDAAMDQGLLKRGLKVEEIFEPSTLQLDVYKRQVKRYRGSGDLSNGAPSRGAWGTNGISLGPFLFGAQRGPCELYRRGQFIGDVYKRQGLRIVLRGQQFPRGPNPGGNHEQLVRHPEFRNHIGLSLIHI